VISVRGIPAVLWAFAFWGFPAAEMLRLAGLLSPHLLIATTESVALRIPVAVALLLWRRRQQRRWRATAGRMTDPQVRFGLMEDIAVRRERLRQRAAELRAGVAAGPDVLADLADAKARLADCETRLAEGEAEREALRGSLTAAVELAGIQPEPERAWSPRVIRGGAA
jgi:hypothetical protein